MGRGFRQAPIMLAGGDVNSNAGWLAGFICVCLLPAFNAEDDDTKLPTLVKVSLRHGCPQS